MTAGRSGDPLRVAVVGSGPSGAFVAQVLTDRAEADGFEVAVDVLDRLPVPYGLVRYGVAPDHPRIKSVIESFRPIFERTEVEFLGNVQVGRDVDLDDLRRHYDAVVIASGAAVDRRLGIPGEDLPGVFSATEFVSWYSGHPDAEVDRFTLNATAAVVVGVGNVALDVARMLTRSHQDLRATDVPEHVLDVLTRSQVRDVHVLGRRGPAQARFSSKELLEIGRVDGVDVLVDDSVRQLDGESLASLEPASRRTVTALQKLAAVSPSGAERRIHLHFDSRPAELAGCGRVETTRVESTRTGPDGSTRGTGRMREVPAQLVLRSIGYRGVPLAGVPFDPERGTVPHRDGRVLDDAGTPVPGLYVAGWIKRGPTGVIGTNKSDADQTVASLLEDAGSLPAAVERDPKAMSRLLSERGVDVVGWAGWLSIDAAELARGAGAGRGRVKMHDWVDLLDAARDAGAGT